MQLETPKANKFAFLQVQNNVRDHFIVLSEYNK